MAYPVLTVSPAETFSVNVPPARLTGNYDRNTVTLDLADNRRLTAQLLKAYTDLCSLCLHADSLPAPLLMRYRMADAQGRTLYASPVKIMVSPGSASFLRQFTCRVSDGFRESFNLGVGASTVWLDIPPDATAPENVASIIVEAAFPVPLVDPRVSTTENRLSMASDTLSFFMPGASADMVPDTVCVCNRARAMIALFHTISVPVLRIDNPFGPEAGSRYMVPLRTLLVDDALNLTRGLLNSLSKFKANKPLPLAASLMLDRPHAFKASTQAIDGDSLLYGHLEVERWRGWDISQWALSTSVATAWQACVIVEFDGAQSRVVWSGEGYGMAPFTLTPLWHYPSVNATAMEIRVRTAAGTAIVRKNLQAVAGYGFACSSDDALEPLTLEFNEAPYLIPSHTAPSLLHGAALAVASAHDPQGVTDAAILPCTSVYRVTNATVATSAWDFSRHRFYAFTDAGIFLVVVDAKGEISTLRLLDTRPVLGASAVAFDTPARGVVAANETEVLRVCESKVTRICRSPQALESVAVRDADIRLNDTYGKTWVIPADIPRAYYTCDADDVLEMMDSGIEVEWMLRTKIASANRPPVAGAVSSKVLLGALCLNLTASSVDLKVTVSTDAGNVANRRTLKSVRLTGALKSALALPLLSVPYSYITLHLRGKVSNDCRFRGATIETFVKSLKNPPHVEGYS